MSNIIDEVSGYWKLNGGLSSDGKQLDYSKRGIDGTLTGTEKYSLLGNGKQVFDFDGSTSIDIGMPTLAPATNGITVFGRIKTSTLANDLVCKGQGAGTDSTFVLNTSVNGKMRVYGYNATGNLRGESSGTVGPLLADGLEHDFMAVYDSDTFEWRMYADGDLQYTIVYRLDTSIIDGKSYLIGKREGLVNEMTGNLWDVAIWPRALTTTEYKHVRQLTQPQSYSPK